MCRLGTLPQRHIRLGTRHQGVRLLDTLPRQDSLLDIVPLELRHVGTRHPGMCLLGTLPQRHIRLGTRPRQRNRPDIVPLELCHVGTLPRRHILLDTRSREIRLLGTLPQQHIPLGTRLRGKRPQGIDLRQGTLLGIHFEQDNLPLGILPLGRSNLGTLLLGKCLAEYFLEMLVAYHWDARRHLRSVVHKFPPDQIRSLLDRHYRSWVVVSRAAGRRSCRRAYH